MASYNPPTYFILGGFNSSFFNVVTTGLSISQANALYLQKTVQDTATQLETFNGGLTTTTLNANNINQTGGTIASTNIIVNLLKTTAIKDSNNSIGITGQLLVNSGTGLLWQYIANPAPIIVEYALANIGTPITVNIPAGSVRLSVLNIAGGGQAGASSGSFYFGTAGAGGACVITYNVICSSVNQLNITKTSVTVGSLTTITSNVVLLGPVPVFSIGAGDTALPIILSKANFGQDGAAGSLANQNVQSLGGSGTAPSNYPSSVASGTLSQGQGQGSVAAAYSSNSGGNYLATSIIQSGSLSYGGYALGSTVSKPANSSTITTSVAGVGRVVIYYYSYI